MESNRMNNLLFRNQFILGPRFCSDFSSWKQHTICQSLVITAHPELIINHYSKNKNSLTLMGYLIDPRRPHYNNDDILKRLMSENPVTFDLIKSTNKLCGNWIIIHKNNDKISLFHDCAGARSIFYTKIDQTKELWCASQPRLIAKMLDLNENKDAIEFILTQKSRTDNYWWPGDTSQYSEIRRLLPNNCLDLNKGVASRYWPDNEIGNLQKNDAIEKISERLRGIMAAAAKRFDLAICLSSGWDSRLMLAACKEIIQEVSVCNAQSHQMSSKHPDLVIPRRLATVLKFELDYLPPPENHNSEFYSILEMNAPYPQMTIASGLQSVLDYYNLQKVGATGNILEIVRGSYRKSNISAERLTNGESLTSIANMGNSQFAIDAHNIWLKTVNDLDLNLYDIYGWELRHGSWLSTNCLLENTSWKEVFFPFNCRNLLIDFLSVPDGHRMPPDHTFFRDLMRYLWPDVLSEPINPKPEVSILYKVLRKLKNFMSPSN